MHKQQNKLLILGGTGFIGIHLTLRLLKEENNFITVLGHKVNEYPEILKKNKRIQIIMGDFCEIKCFDKLVADHKFVFHLVSTTVPASSNKSISDELVQNIQSTTLLLEACVRQQVQRVCFVSSGGAIYGISGCRSKEEDPQQPITAYGIQKLTIEKLLYLYYYQYGMDYRIVRIANPYGPYQRVDGLQGIVSTFIYRALQGENLVVYGDGVAVRDYIYIEDAVTALVNVMNDNTCYKLYNIGSGKGITINQLILLIQKILDLSVFVRYEPVRKVDVPLNILNVNRYEKEFGKIATTDFITGIKKTAEFYRSKLEIT